MKQRGFVLVTALGLVALLSLAGVSIMMRGLWQSTLGERVYNRSRALHLADAALDQAVRNLRTADVSDDLMADTLDSGSFQVELQQVLSGNLYRVTSRGTSGMEQRRVEAVFRLIPESIFQYALFGNDGMNVSGHATTDSYDSSLGPYDDDCSDGSCNVEHNGDVGTNASADGSVDLGGSIFIDGQVAVGYDAIDPLDVVADYDPAFITGGTDPPSDTQDIVAQTNAFPMPAVVVPAGLLCGDLTVSAGDTETLSPTGGTLGDGSYCYQNLTIEGGGTLTASGSVTVYITGQFIARGNSLMGVPSDPSQMLVQLSPSGDATLEPGILTGTTGFYGALYGPQSTINISGNAEIYGSVIADQINVTGSAEIHYDESMTELSEISNTFTIQRIAWREL